jgi:hypothetical protein
MTLAFRIALILVILQLLIDAWKLLRPRISTRTLAF